MRKEKRQIETASSSLLARVNKCLCPFCLQLTQRITLPLTATQQIYIKQIYFTEQYVYGPHRRVLSGVAKLAF
jgi:hypothetical protein